jgi:hypothetical protein
VRLRADLLPLLARVRPGAAARLLAAAERAGAWRTHADAWVAAFAPDGRAPVRQLAALDADALAVFWPAFAARAGVRLDRRALARLVAFTRHAAQRVRDGTVQPAWVPVAGTPPTAVVFAYGPTTPGAVERAWHFTVRPTLAPGGAATPPPNGSLGVAAPGLPDYA